MPKYQTTRDLELSFQRFHKVKVNAGTPVQAIQCGTGIEYAVNPSLCETDSQTGAGTIWAHDTKYYYIFVPRDAVAEVEG